LTPLFGVLAAMTSLLPKAPTTRHYVTPRDTEFVCDNVTHILCHILT